MDDAFLQSLLFSWSKLNLLQNHLSKCSWPTQTTVIVVLQHLRESVFKQRMMLRTYIRVIFRER